MNNGINRINGRNSGWVSFGQQRQDEDVSEKQTQQAPVNNYEETQVDPSKVMDFLVANNSLVAPLKANTASVNVDDATRQRVEGYMKDFEVVYSVVAEEFGEELAPEFLDALITAGDGDGQQPEQLPWGFLIRFLMDWGFSYGYNPYNPNAEPIIA